MAQPHDPLIAFNPNLAHAFPQKLPARVLRLQGVALIAGGWSVTSCFRWIGEACWNSEAEIRFVTLIGARTFAVKSITT